VHLRVIVLVQRLVHDLAVELLEFELARVVLVMTAVAKLALLGCALGVLGSLVVSRLVKSFLFEVSATDPIIYLVGVLVMMAMALLASALPAARAAAADPAPALRSI